LVSLYYADTSAVLKLLVEEPHSTAFAALYDSTPDAEWISSALLRVEMTRAVLRTRPALLPKTKELLRGFAYITIDDDVIDAAMNEPDRGLRSLDAIHLATARTLGPEIDAIVTYDDRLSHAASNAGFGVLSPRD
jgi:uncharacterized protein